MGTVDGFCCGWSWYRKLEKSSNKVTPAINVIIEQKTTDKDKENATDTTKDDGGGPQKVVHLFVCSMLVEISDAFISGYRRRRS